MSDTPENTPPKKSRWWRWPAYAVLVLALAMGLLWAADRIVGLLLPPYDFPPNGVASPPLEDKSIEFVDFAYTASTNSMGLRDAEMPPESEHAIRIAAIGDSYTFGWGVELEDAWIKQLERMLRERGLDVEVVNIGQPGAGPIEFARHAKAAVDQLNPDLILVSILQGNDLNQTYLPRLARPLYRYLPNLHRLRTEWDQIFSDEPDPPTGPRMVQSAEEHNQYLRGVALQMRDSMSPETRARYEQLDDEVKELFLAGRINPWMIFEAADTEDCFTGITDLDSSDTRQKIDLLGFILEDIKDYAAAHGARTIALSVPNGIYDNEHMYARIQRIGYNVDSSILRNHAVDHAASIACDRAGVPLIIVTEVFHAHTRDPDLYFEYDHHFTEKGHHLFAEQIAPEIESKVRETIADQ